LLNIQADGYFRDCAARLLACARTKALIDKLLRYLYKLVHKLDGRKSGPFMLPLALSFNPDIFHAISKHSAG